MSFTIPKIYFTIVKQYAQFLVLLLHMLFRSISQMSNLYTFIWKEMASSRHKITKELHSGSCVFVPYASGSSHEDVVPGMFLSPEEICWHDPTGCLDQIKEINPQCSLTEVTHCPLKKTLSNIYPGLRDLFIDGCRIHETPPLRSYLQILLQLSTVTLPSQAANAVFQVFLKWSDGLKSGLLGPEDIIYLKEHLMKINCAVLPTEYDKWISLHPSFGLVCWSDNLKLWKQFKHFDKIEFLYVSKLSEDEKQILRTKVSVLMQTIGIPALSDVVTCEAIYDGLVDSSFKASLVGWALPYAQRYFCSVHPDKYVKLKQSGFDLLNRLQVVVEKLYYRNVIKSCGDSCASKKRIECCSLLQDNVLYTIQESDSHALFMELSRLLFDGTPDLHFASFLHMITTMAESGSTEEQTEFFILNSQKMPKLSNEESVWSLPSIPSRTENDDTPNNYARLNGFKTQATAAQPSGSPRKDDSEGTVMETDNVPISIEDDWTIEDDFVVLSANLENQSGNACNSTYSDQFGHAPNYTVSTMHVEFDPVDLDLVSDGLELGASNFSSRDHLRFGTPNAAQAMQTGRIGESVAFKYIIGKFGGTAVKWVNEDIETGLPYDIIVGEENSREYIEVKATKSRTKDWFNISTREWQFAVEKGESSALHMFC
nr:hypothetical protein CFP56_39543 [Quercus suber]